MKTADRILDASLSLLNQQGSARVTTNAIADAADLSIGNLYYHFKNKDEILLALIGQFETELAKNVNDSLEATSIQDWIDWWLVWFRLIQQYEFLFHDQMYLVNGNPHIRHRYHLLITKVERKQLAILSDLKLQQVLIATTQDLNNLSREVTFIALFWQDFYRLRNITETKLLPYQSAMQQILGLILPYLPARQQLEVESIMGDIIPLPS